MAEENVGHEIKQAFENGCFDEMFVGVCGEIEVSDCLKVKERDFCPK